MTYADYYEKLYIAYMNNVPLSYISVLQDKYYNLQDYIPKNKTIDNLESSLKNILPILKYWLINPQTYIIEYFKDSTLSNENISQINEIVYEYLRKELVKSDFQKTMDPLDLTSDQLRFIESIMRNYKKELSKVTTGITYYANINQKPSIQDFATSTEIPIIVNKELIETEKETQSGNIKKKDYVITDIKAETTFTDSKFINYFLDKTKQGFNIMLLPTIDFSLFKKIKCYIKNPITQKDPYELYVTTTSSLWNSSKNIIDKNIKLDISDFKIYSKKYIIKIDGNIEQNSFYHFLMTNFNLFECLVPIDSIKILKTNTRSYVRFVGRSSTISTAILYNEANNITINYISYVESYRDTFYIEFLISCINLYLVYQSQIYKLYSDFFQKSTEGEKKMISTGKKVLTNKSCQKSNAPLILSYNEDNLKLAFSNNSSYGFLTKEHLNNAYSTDINGEYILLKCGIDEDGNETKYKYFGIGQSTDQKIYACCYENENKYVKINAVKYKENKDLVQTIKTSYRISTGNKNLKGDDIGYINDPLRSFLKKTIDFNEDSFEVYRKSFITNEENNIIELVSIIFNKKYDDLKRYIDNNFQKISQSLLSKSTKNYKNFEYLNIIEDLLNTNFYVLSKNGVEVGKYNHYYVKAYTNKNCVIIYKNINEKDNTYTYELICLGDNQETTKKDLKFVFDKKVNYFMYNSLLLSTNINIIDGVINYCNMNFIFYEIADYQLIDENGKTYGIVISKDNTNFNFNEDKYIFFSPSSNMNIPVYDKIVKNASITSLIKYGNMKSIIDKIKDNLVNYMKYLYDVYDFTFEIYSKDLDNDENLIGLTFALSIKIKDKNVESFQLINGNKPVEFYFPIFPKNDLKNIINSLPLMKSIYRIPFCYNYDNSTKLIVEQNDPVLKNILINQIYNNFITFVINLSNDQNISLYDFSKYIIKDSYSLNIESFYDTYVNYKKIQEKNPNIFYESNNKVYLKLPDPYFTHTIQFLKNPRSIILNKSFSDISDLLRIIQLSDPINNDIINKHKITKTIVDLIEPYYILFNNKIYLVQKINESSVQRLNSIINAWNDLKINLGYNCTESGDFNYINQMIEKYKLNVAYFDTNKNVILSTDSSKNNSNILFINIEYKTQSNNTEILENMNAYTDIYIMLYVL